MFHCKVRRLRKALRRTPRRVAFAAMAFVAVFGPALQVYAGQRTVKVGRITELRGVKVSDRLIPSPIEPVPAPSPKMRELAQFLSQIPANEEIEATDDGVRYGHLTVGGFVPPSEAQKANAEVNAPLFLDGTSGDLSPAGSAWTRVNSSVGTINSRITMTQDGVESMLDTTLYMQDGYLYLSGHLTKMAVDGEEGGAPLYMGSGGWRSRDGIAWEQVDLGTTAAAAADFYDEADDMVSDVSDCPAAAAVACAPAVAVGVVIVVIIIIVCYLFCWLLWYVDATQRWDIRQELRRNSGLPWEPGFVPSLEGGARC